MTNQCSICPWRYVHASKMPRVVPKCRERKGKPCTGTMLRRKELQCEKP